MIPVSKWEALVRTDKMVPVRRVSYKGIDIYVASGGLRAPDDFNADGHYYKTMWAVGADGKLDTASPLAFDMAHDTSLPLMAREPARINATIQAAQDFIDTNVEAGRYD